MADPSAVLRYAVRPRVVLKYVGQLAFVLALLSFFPLTVSFLARTPAQAVRYAWVIGILLLLAAASRHQPTPKHVQTNEALTVIALAFVLAALAMAYPLAGAGLHWSDALFESVSGVTTTGLTTLSRVEDRGTGFLFARAWMQWYGGLGFVVLLVALLMGSEIGARRLTEPYASETMLTTTRIHARRMLAVYLTLTGFGFVLMWMALGEPFAAVVHTLAAVSTGGFSSYDQSLGELGSWTARYSVIGVALCGAVPLPLYLAIRSRRSGIFLDRELRALLIALLAVGFALTMLFHFKNGNTWKDSLGHGLLMGISAQTTTGFSSIDISNVGDPAMLLMIIAMFIGGGLGSTAGGIKILRALMVIYVIVAAVRRSALAPHAVAGDAVLGGRSISHDEIRRTLVLITLYTGVTVVSWIIFLTYGYPPLDALFEVVSAVGTVGLSTGITSAELQPLLKGLLSMDMLLGRLEIFAFLVLFYPHNWFGNRID